MLFRHTTSLTESEVEGIEKAECSRLQTFRHHLGTTLTESV
jgi:hypothetical protein